MLSENKHITNLFDKLKIPISFLRTCIIFITIYSIFDLVRFYYSGDSLRESTLILIAIFGIVSNICSIVIDNRITKIKKIILDLRV
jgi:hypothetical protein